MTVTVNIAKDYTPYLGGRYVEDGSGNGTTFRTKFLVPALRSIDQEEEGKILIILDEAAGYPSSFLEEAFGGLVRTEGFDRDLLLKVLDFKADQPGFSRFIRQIRNYIENAKPEQA